MADYRRVFAAGAEFNSATELYNAAEKIRDAGFSKWDCHSPFPIHGMDKAMGMSKSRLSAFVFICGVLGFITGLLLVTVTTFQLYPIVVHGKPIEWWPGLGSLQFMFPPIYELTILFSAFGATFGMMIWNGLPKHNHPIFNWSRFAKVTDDKFFLIIEAKDPKFSETKTTALLQEIGGQHVTLIHEET